LAFKNPGKAKKGAFFFLIKVGEALKQVVGKKRAK